MLASIAHRMPPRGYGPWEQVASTLAEGLVALGHDVTLFATADSAHVRAAARRGARAATRRIRRVDAKVYECLHIAAAFERADEFDVLSNQFDFLPLTYSRLVSTPVVTTIHGFSSERIVPVYRAYDDIGHYVAISDADRHPDLTYAATIHHGIDLAPFTFRAGRGGYLLFLGRIHPDKGTHGRSRSRAGPGCRWSSPGSCRTRTTSGSSSNRTLDGAGRHATSGPVGPAERDALLGGALALLHLIGFDEPFGLSVVESLATGTPVIAYPLGSMPEIIRHGRHRLPGRRRRRRGRGGRPRSAPCRAGDCRDDVEERFTAARMVADYAELFARIASAARRPQPLDEERDVDEGEPDRASLAP